MPPTTVAERAARASEASLRIPGSQGQGSPQVVIQRVGREAVMEEALREALPSGTSAHCSRRA